MTFNRKPYVKPPRAMPVRSSIPLSSPVRMAEATSFMRTEHAHATRPVHQKTPQRVQQSIRDSARGEECLVRIPGVCTSDPEKTIWSHAPLGAAGKGRSIKALDLCGAFCCTACDAAIDGQAPLPAGYSRAQALEDWFMGHMRSLVRLRQKGLI